MMLFSIILIVLFLQHFVLSRFKSTWILLILPFLSIVFSSYYIYTTNKINLVSIISIVLMGIVFFMSGITSKDDLRKEKQENFVKKSFIDEE